MVLHDVKRRDVAIQLNLLLMNAEFLSWIKTIIDETDLIMQMHISISKRFGTIYLTYVFYNTGCLCYNMTEFYKFLIVEERFSFVFLLVFRDQVVWFALMSCHFGSCYLCGWSVNTFSATEKFQGRTVHSTDYLLLSSSTQWSFAVSILPSSKELLEPHVILVTFLVVVLVVWWLFFLCWCKWFHFVVVLVCLNIRC